MKPSNIGKGIVIGVVLLAILALLFYTTYKLSSLIGFIIIAIAVTLIGRPIVIFLRKKLRFPNVLAVLLYLTSILGIVIGVIVLFVPVVAEQGESLLDVGSLQKKLNELYLKLREMGAPREVVDQIIMEGDIQENVMEGIEEGIVPDLISTFLAMIAKLGVGIFSVLFIAFFFLWRGNHIQKRLLVHVSPRYRKKAISAIDESKDLLSRYLVGLLIQMTIVFIIYLTGLSLGGIENAIIIALVGALFNIIPYVGPLIGGGLMLSLAITSNLELDLSTEILPSMAYVLGGFVVAQLVDNLFSQPFIFSNSTKSHPLEIFIVIVAAGLLFGLVGMIIAVPGYTILRVVLKEFFNDKPLYKFFGPYSE